MNDSQNTPLGDDASFAGLDWSTVREVRMPEALSAALLDRTRAMVRGRARRRRWRLAAGWGLTYAAGICTALVLRPHETVQPQIVQVAGLPEDGSRGQIRDSASPPRPMTGSDDAPLPKSTRLENLTPEDLRERAAGAPRAEQIRLLRLAGDRYLYGAADMRAALNCYQQVIELTPRDELARIEPHDGWLLAELKQSAAEQ